MLPKRHELPGSNYWGVRCLESPAKSREMSPGLHVGNHKAQYRKEDVTTWDARAFGVFVDCHGQSMTDSVLPLLVLGRARCRTLATVTLPSQEGLSDELIGAL